MKKRGKKLTKRQLIILIVAVIVIIALLYIFSQPSVRKEILGLNGRLATIGLGGQLQEDLVAYYEFEGNVNDESGNSNHCVVNVGSGDYVEYVEGILGQALNFDGDEDYINCGDDASLRITDNLTISLWIKPDALDNPTAAILTKGAMYEGPAGYYRGGYAIGLHNNLVFLDLYTINTSSTVSDPYSTRFARNSVVMNLQDTDWHHIVMTFNPDNKRLGGYLDGGYYDSVITTYPKINNPSTSYPRTNNRDINLLIGRNGRDVPSVNDFKGLVDDVRIYNRVLDYSEIAALFSEEISVTRDVACGGVIHSTDYSVTLDISAPRLARDEIMIISEKIPNGTSIFWGSVPPTYNFGDTLTWLFAKEPPVTFGEENITEPIPSEITYEIKGVGAGEFRGKVGLGAVMVDWLIEGETSLPAC